MNYYDTEENIIELLQDTPFREIHMENLSKGVLEFFSSLYQKEKYKNWKNNSAKNLIPPDFYSDKYKYMLEVMRVDDYRIGNNSPNALESKIIREIETERRKNGFLSFKESNIRIYVVPDMSKASENSYEIYLENFKRIIEKHVRKIEKYRDSHPGYKLGFMIFDESPGYAKVSDAGVHYNAGDAAQVAPHWHFRDKNFLQNILDADLDFLIWITPYKNLPMNPRIYPAISVFDMKKRTVLKRRLIEYDPKLMVCLEVE